MKSSPHKTSPPQLNSLQKAIIALLKRDFPAAVSLFCISYHSTDWQKRDAAVTGLGDILDSRIMEHGKLPAVLASVYWHPPQGITPGKRAISNDRLLALLEQFMQPVLWKPHSRTEQKALLAMRSAEQTLESILLNDGHHLVRFSALLTLTEMLGEERHSLILTTLERAYRQENHATLKTVIARFLHKN